MALHSFSLAIKFLSYKKHFIKDVPSKASFIDFDTINFIH
jgi:hypothetical protein